MEITAVFTQMGTLVFVIVLGFLGSKFRFIPKDFSKAMTPVIMNILLPCTVLSSAFSCKIDMSIGRMLLLFGISSFFYIMNGLVGYTASRKLRPNDPRQNVDTFAVMFPNTAFVAFPVMQALYGAEGVLMAALVNIPFGLLIYTAGDMLMFGSFRRESIKRIFSFSSAITFVALGLVLVKADVPPIMGTLSSAVAAATAPMSMLVVGASLGSISFKQVFGDWRVYIYSFLRVILCPILAWLIASLVIQDEITISAIVISMGAPSAMLVTVFALEHNKDWALAASHVFISTIMSAFTIPLILKFVL